MVVSGSCMCLYAVLLHVVAVFVSWILVMVGWACLKWGPLEGEGVVYLESGICLPRQTVLYMVVSGSCMCLYGVVLLVVAVFVRGGSC